MWGGASLVQQVIPILGGPIGSEDAIGSPMRGSAIDLWGPQSDSGAVGEGTGALFVTLNPERDAVVDVVIIIQETRQLLNESSDHSLARAT